MPPPGAQLPPVGAFLPHGLWQTWPLCWQPCWHFPSLVPLPRAVPEALRARPPPPPGTAGRARQPRPPRPQGRPRPRSVRQVAGGSGPQFLQGGPGHSGLPSDRVPFLLAPGGLDRAHCPCRSLFQVRWESRAFWVRTSGVAAAGGRRSGRAWAGHGSELRVAGARRALLWGPPQRPGTGRLPQPGQLPLPAVPLNWLTRPWAAGPCAWCWPRPAAQPGAVV